MPKNRENGPQFKGQLKAPVYDFLDVENLTPEQLLALATKMPDMYLRHINVKFQSEIGKHYEAVHVYDHPNGPYILLVGTDKDRRDFSNVEKTLTEIESGKPAHKIVERMDDICDVISLKQKPTQQRVAFRAQEYAQFFNGVSISVVQYVDIPQTVLSAVGIRVQVGKQK